MRRKTTTVRIGNLVLSDHDPVMIQSMLNTSTMDTEACVEQAIRIIRAGGQLVRITAQGVREAENLKNIHAALRARGYDTPLSADIHFMPEAAIVAARYVEKVRINPGNFIDKRAVFKQVTYTDEAYADELARLEEKLTEFLEICREHQTAVRIGTNHGSLSDRIMSRYGDTPAGMVEATMEYLRVCFKTGFDDVVISLKSSDCRVMVDAVRLLVREMEKEGMCYPLHLGVTEAGEGEDGRIRSAVGIGTLLNEGIGDTIRVSLTEAPEAEIPVAKFLTEICNRPMYEEGNLPLRGEYSKPLIVADLSGLIVIDETVSGALGFTMGAPNDPVYGDRLQASLKAPEMIFTGALGPELTKLPENTVVIVPLELLDMAHVYNRNASPLCLMDEFIQMEALPECRHLFVQVKQPADMDAAFAARLPENAVLVFCFGADYQSYRAAFERMLLLGISCKAVIRVVADGNDRDRINMEIASQVGGFFLDRLAWGVWITLPGIDGVDYALGLSRNILQSAGARRYKTEFISCPGCGRTLFDLQGAVARVKKAFGHLNTLKIAVMGCVVNGPGEMGDADYGYVGAGNGKVNLYKGKQIMKTGVPEEDAIEELRRLIGPETEI